MQSVNSVLTPIDFSENADTVFKAAVFLAV